MIIRIIRSRRKRLVLLIMVLVLCIGCARQMIIDKLSIVIALGYDQSQQEQERIRTTIIAYHATDNQAKNTLLTSASNNTSKGVRTKLNLKMPTQDVIGQVRVIAYGEPIARKGIITLTDTLQRDSDIGTNVYLAIAGGSAEQIMSATNKQQINMGEYLYELIRKNVNYGIIPSSNLHHFLSTYYRGGKDPVLPYLELQQNEVVISGVALMKDDRMVGRLNEDDCLLLKSAMGNYKFDSFELALSLKESNHHYLPRISPLFITLTNIKIKSNIKLAQEEGPVFDVRIRVKGQLKEVSEQIDLEKRETIHALEHAASRQIAAQYEVLFKRLQQMQVDPIGYGAVYRTSVRTKQFATEQWRDMYKHARIRTDIKVVFTNVGITS